MDGEGDRVGGGGVVRSPLRLLRSRPVPHSYAWEKRAAVPTARQSTHRPMKPKRMRLMWTMNSSSILGPRGRPPPPAAGVDGPAAEEDPEVLLVAMI